MERLWQKIRDCACDRSDLGIGEGKAVGDRGGEDLVGSMRSLSSRVGRLVADGSLDGG